MTQVGEGVHAASGSASNCECTATGHPIDVATGRVFVVDKDLTFTHPLTIGLFRTWASTHADRNGLFGRGWTTFLDLRLEIEADEILYYDDEGRAIAFPPVVVGDSYYDAAEKLTLNRKKNRIEIAQSNGRTYLFSTEGALIGVQSDGYDTIELIYENGWLAGLRDAGAKRYRFAYDESQRVADIYCHTEAAGKEIRIRGYDYDKWNRLTVVYDELQQPIQYFYDENHRLIKEINRNGYCYQYAYDSEGRCVENWGENGEYRRTLRYIARQQKTEVHNSLGDKTTYYWNTDGMVVMVIDAMGGVRQYHYDQYRRPLGEIDANQNTIVYESDQQGRQTVKIDQENNRWETVYEDGKPDVHIDPLGNQIIRLYDGDDNLIQEEDGEGNRQTYHHTAEGKRIKENDSAIRKEYDEWHRLLRERDSRGGERRFFYDPKGRLILERDKNGSETSYGYDAEDNLLWIRDPLGNERRFIYRGLNKLIEQRDGNGNAVKFEYDSEGQVIALLNENNEKHTFAYDACGRLSSDTGFAGETNTYGYDPEGNVIAVSRPGGGALNIRYDKTGRVVEIAGHDPAGTQCRNAYKYDEAGRLIEASNEHSLVTFEYDALGRIIKERQGEQSIERIYDASGNLIARKGPWDTSIEFEYDENDKLVGVTLPDDKIIRLVRNDQGQPIERHLPGGSYSLCRHDAEGHLLAQDIHGPTDEPLIRRRYKYDPNGRLSGIEDNGRNAKQYAYDPAGCLARIVSGHEQEPEDFIYDSAGNLLKRGDRFQARYANGSRLLRADGFDYTHDARGNIIERHGENGITRLAYNSFNQLISGFNLTVGCDLNYFYDALGRRIRKKAFDGSEVIYYWDQFQLIAEGHGNDDKAIYIFKPETFIPLAFLLEFRHNLFLSA